MSDFIVCIILSTVGFYVGFWVGVFTEAARLKKWFRKELDKCYGGKGGDRAGRWVDKGVYAVCTECGGRSGTQYDGVEPIALMTQFCQNCGARMEPDAGTGKEADDVKHC